MDKEAKVKLNELLGTFRVALWTTSLLVFSSEICSVIFQSSHSVSSRTYGYNGE
jgi:hypothetical protein